MKLTFNISSLSYDIWEKALIFIIFFSSFYISITRMLHLPAFVNTILIAVILIGAYAFNHAKLCVKGVFTYVVLFFLCLFNMLIFNVTPDEYIITFFVSVLTGLILSSSINLEDNQQFICNVSCVYLVVLFIYMVTSYSRSVNYYSDTIDFMGFAYYGTPSILVVAYNYLKKRKIVYLAISVLGIMYLLICGTRGPFLCCFAFALFCTWHELKGHSLKNKLLIFGLIIALAILVMNLDSICEYLYPIFQRKGFSTRWMLYFMDRGDLIGLSGRDNIYEIIIKNINRSPIFGHGLLSDRSILGGLYTHNLILEVLYIFGVPIGGLLLMTLLGLVIYSYLNTKSEDYRYYIAIYVCASIVKLMVSSSFLQEQSLFILIGICFAANSKKKNA